MLKNLLSNLNVMNLNASQFSISKLDDNSKIAFPVLFSTFALVYWSYYLCTESHGGGEDNY